MSIVSDYDRGLSFLRRLAAADDPDNYDPDWSAAGSALFDVLEVGLDPEEVVRSNVEALGRVLP